MLKSARHRFGMNMVLIKKLIMILKRN